ncbi:hypothetical protein [Aestuariivirga litoralis]|uniref:hypothetical protein n=1 Tax=Aestuariivirga litoralis TaxID=2650924 RepID=UPI001AEDF033|nr:hypothetical protein [Aestuariivirga litoralis]
MTTSIERELGNLQARMEAVESELHAIREDMREIRDVLVSAKGGWRLFMLAFGFAASVGAALDHFVPLLRRG